LPTGLSEKLHFLDLFDFVKTYHLLDQNPLPEKFILEILSDSYVQEASLSDYELIRKVKKIFSEFSILKSMETDLDKKILQRLYALLTDKNESAVVFDNDKKLDAFFVKKNIRNFSDDLIEEAVFVNNGIFASAPVSDSLTTLSYIAMQFILIRSGFFIIPFSYIEYLESLKISSHGKDLRPMYELTVENAIKKAEKIIKIIDIDSLK
ncbi:MAG: hypothetical protein LBD41_07590, partial [Clostridiales Family XIII bacterium]|nr:hypothetical protein [Clostridiales Family XIII bacterium]